MNLDLEELQITRSRNVPNICSVANINRFPRLSSALGDIPTQIKSILICEENIAVVLAGSAAIFLLDEVEHESRGTAAATP